MFFFSSFLLRSERAREGGRWVAVVTSWTLIGLKDKSHQTKKNEARQTVILMS